MRRSLSDPFVLCFYDYYMGWISVLYLVNVILASWGSGFDYCGLFLFNLQIPIDHVDTAIKYWIMNHPTCTACDAVVTASEQDRAVQRGGICARMHRVQKRVCVCVTECARMWAWANGCERVRIHAWVNTAGRQQLWQASAVERDECCHSQVTPNHSQKRPLISSLVPPLPRLPSPVDRTWRCSLLLGLIGHENTRVCDDLLTAPTTEHTRGVRTPLLQFLLVSFSERPDKHPPLCLISTITER